MARKKVARLANLPMDYQRLGLKDEIAKWEDGHRTNGKFGEYEWWYFDSKMDDGTALVINFYTQPVTAIYPYYVPSMTFSFTKDGETFTDSAKFKMKDCFFDKEKCCVKLGASVFEGDLHNYHILCKTERVQAEVRLTANAPSWRPGTGHFIFDESKYFAWLPSVPEGKVEATVTIDGETYELQGTGYHDHNWGNTGMFWIMHHWYWGRAKVADYQLISSYITAHEPYGYEHFPIFMISKNGVKLGDDPKNLTYSQSDPKFDPITRKHYHQKLVYDYNDGKQHYRVTYLAEEIIETFVVADSKTSVQAKSNPIQLWLVKKSGLAPSYIRLAGTVTLEKFEGDDVVEKHKAPGIWEQMYFGMDEDV